MNKWFYWINAGLISSSYYIIAGVLFGMFKSVIDGELTFMNVASTGLYYGLVMSTMVICFMNISKTVFMANIVISMGETRKNSLYGIHIMNLTTVLTTIIVVALLSLFTNGELLSLFTALVALPGAFIMAVGLGMLINTMNFNNSIVLNGIQTVTMIISPLFLVLILLLSGCFGVDIGTEMDIDINFKLITCIFSYAAGALILVISSIRMKKKIANLEIKL